jgi:hypothetical protein
VAGIEVHVRGGELGDAAAAIPAALEPAIAEIVALLEARVREETPLGVTALARGSIAGEVHRIAGGIPIGVVGSPLPYLRVVNDGRRPGQKMPMQKVGGEFQALPDLVLWVKRKLKVEYSNVRSRKTHQRNATDDEALGLAFVVARAIGKRGTKPVGMFEKAIRSSEATIEAILDRAGYQMVKKITSPGET